MAAQPIVSMSKGGMFLVLLAVLVSPGAAQRSGSAAPTDQQQAQQLQSALAGKIDELGACNTERGQLQQLSAKVLTGQLATPAQVIAQVRTAFERANPGKTLSNDWLVVDKTTKEGPTTQ